MTSTTNLGLPIYSNNDVPKWDDTNTPFQTLDNKIGELGKCKLIHQCTNLTTYGNAFSELTPYYNDLSKDEKLRSFLIISNQRFNLSDIGGCYMGGYENNEFHLQFATITQTRFVEYQSVGGAVTLISLANNPASNGVALYVQY